MLKEVTRNDELRACHFSEYRLIIEDLRDWPNSLSLS